MTQRHKDRVKDLEHTPHRVSDREGGGEDFDFAGALREARLRAAAKDPIPQTVITPEMMECPVNGEFWRQMSEARKRARLLRQ